LQSGSFNAVGEKQGRWCRYHPNGKLMDEGHFEGGKKAGVWTTYDVSGAVKQTRDYGS
jgi:antitoxin component YwqK of YwqJK toxin-antitoxin module